MDEQTQKALIKALGLLGKGLMLVSIIVIGFCAGAMYGGIIQIHANGNIILNEYADCTANNQNNNSLIVPQFIYTNFSFYAYTCNLPASVRNQTFYLQIAGSGHTLNQSISLLQDWHYINLPQLNNYLHLQDNAMVTFQLLDSQGIVWASSYAIAINIVNVQSIIGL